MPERKIITEAMFFKEIPHSLERIQFRSLLMSNPNYFGNLIESPFKPVLKLITNSTYEKIASVGFQPQFNRLEAVIYIEQPYGYGGGICSAGTPEFVRFYMRDNEGSDWEDLGMSSFTAYNIPEGTQGDQHLEYAVSLTIEPTSKFCMIENLKEVRAILSWNDPPPPDTPDHKPVWGDIHDTHIQIDRRQFFLLKDLFAHLKIEYVPELLQVIDVEKQYAAAEPKALTALELKDLYAKEDVGTHRFAHKELMNFISDPINAVPMMAEKSLPFLSDLKIDWKKFLPLLYPKDGDKSFEELECIGYNPNLDTLSAVIRIKKKSGYSGNLCSAGSKEYVTFWADFNNNGIYETCLGTTSVNVYDINGVPEEGLEYAVFLPVNLLERRKPCQQGPVLVPIRAILSWQTTPACGNPDYVPHWGNRLETLIHIKPGPAVQPNTHVPFIQTVGSMHVDNINNATGLASGPAEQVGFTAAESPFGGWVIVTGHIANPPEIFPSSDKLKYRVEISDDGINWQNLNNSFTLKLDRLLNGVWSSLPSITMQTDSDGWYEYQEDLSGGPGNPQIFPSGNVLARWHTGGLTGLWKLRIRAKDPNTGPIFTSNTVTVKIDNKAPDAAITITSGTGPCGDFTIGDIIEGSYSATDLHFKTLSLSVVPGLGGSFTAPAPIPVGSTMPLVRSYAGGVPTTGDSGTWKLDTVTMPKCGYVVYLHVWDRAIVNSGYVGHHASSVVGLCLREPTKKVK
jgi:hypothetical protein